MDMDRNVTAFRERFKAYKNGKSISEIYDAGLPKYDTGKPAYQKFVEDMGPVLFLEILNQGVQNPGVAYRNMITLLAYESNYGLSRVAKEQNNYGGVGWDGKTYTTYKDKSDFAKNYVKLMNSRYKNVIGADTLEDYAKGLKGLKYYEDTVENYTKNLTGMKSFAKALNEHITSNPKLYLLQNQSDWGDVHQLKVNLWGDEWQSRLTPSARSKVVQKWSATGSKPESESSLEYTKRRIKETAWKKPSGTKMLEMAPAAVDFTPIAGDIKQGLEATAAGLRGNYLEASLLGGGLLIPNTIENILKPAAKRYINAYRLSKAMKMDEDKIDPISRSFRNLEWSNFLSTVNGDNYYRMVHGNEHLNPNQKYFMSHTTPWEEFSGLGSEYNTGIEKLYEFPTDTFGRLRSSSDTGVYSDDDVIDMGMKHLLYGDTSSGFRGPVKILSDNNAAVLGIEPTKIGISERPINLNGLYDSNPTYDNIRMGNQTVVRGRRLKDAISNSQHSEYYPTKNGIQKVLYYPNGQFQKYGVMPDWRNPINNALSVLQQDKMLGEYIGHGAERQVFSDRRNPGRVIKIGGGLNGEQNILNFNQLRDAVEYTMEMNKLPGVAPISYEGFIDEKGTLIPWFSQKQVIPMDKIADPFYTFSKPIILPNGKPITKGKLSAIRNINYEKLLSPLGYKNSPNGFVLPNYPYTVRDLGLKNIGFDLNGNVKIFDPLIDL